MRILHISDLHLGAKLSAFTPSAIREIRLFMEQGLSEIKKSLSEGYYDALILAGDILESENVSAYNLRFIESCLESVLNSGGFAVYATGNHDYWISEKHFKAIADNERFILFTDGGVKRREILYKGQKIAIYGIGYTSIHPSKDVGHEFPVRDSEDIAIGVLHGEISRFDVLKSNYYTANLDVLKTKNYDYFALGHVHNFTDFGSGICYAGCTFPQGYDEAGKKYGLEVNIEPGEGTTVETRNFAKYQICDINFSSDSDDVGRLALDLNSKIEKISEKDSLRPIIRINVNLEKPILPSGKADLMMMEQVFGYKDSELHSLYFKNNIIDTSEKTKIPDEILEALSEALNNVIEKTGKINELTSPLACALSLNQLIKKYNIKDSILKKMEAGNVD